MAEDDNGAGIVAHYGSVTAFFRFFGDVGARYDSIEVLPGAANASFLSGSFDFFSTARLGDHVQTLAEVVAEFEDDTNEVGFELERLWAKWSACDELYLKLGREHAPVSHWNRSFHHGRIFWPAVTQPFVATFEDQGGPLPIHATGIEVGGTWHSGIGDLGYAGGISNGRGLEFGEVENVTDRNDSKAYDAGLQFAPSALPSLVFGVNYRSDEIPVDPAAGPGAIAYDESILTAFIDWRAEHWYVLSEYVTIQHDDPTGGPDYDHTSWYVEANYRIGRFEPYVRADVRDMAEGDPFYTVADLDLDQWNGLLGVRMDLGDHAAFKIEGGTGRTEQRDASSAVFKDSFNFADMALQWMF